MKNALKILATALVAMLFASCSQQAIYHGEGGNTATTAHYVASGSSKEIAAPQQTYVATPVKKAKDCRKCGSFFCAKPGCCGVVSKQVLSRATAQGGSGEPHIGLIPTMKTLAP